MIVSGKKFFGGGPGTVVQPAGTPPINIPSKAERKSLWESLKSGAAGIAQDVKETGQNIGTTIDKAGKGIDEAVGAAARGKISPLRAAGQALGIGAGAASGVAGDVVVGAAKTLLPQGAEDAVKEGVGAVAKPVIENTPIKSLMENYQALADDPSEEAQAKKRDIDALLGVGSFALDAIGTKAASKPVMAAVKGGAKVAEGVAKVSQDVAGGIARAGLAVKDVAKGTAGTVANAAEYVSRIPGRVGVNVAEKQAVREVIKSLPDGVARKAAQNGIDVSDVKHLISIPRDQKAPLKKLYSVVKKFSKGDTSTNPIEVIGRPIIGRLKQLESARVKVGKKLGDAADNLGIVTTEELSPAVFGSLKKVPGLHGLKVNANGGLDFSETVLATMATKADRKAIQGMFRDATKWGQGKKKHLLRQELFEVLGGKKKALTQLTDTQEKSFEAIREGLSDVLESKNPAYKTISNEYRKIVQPIQDMRKFMKNVAGADEDILDMSAGLLARRITSNSSSNPQIRKILRAMDEATKIPGKASLSVETMQDFYNVLERYYDIAAKTGFQGQIKSALEFPSGAMDAVFKGAKAFAGETPAVRQKALEQLLDEILL